MIVTQRVRKKTSNTDVIIFIIEADIINSTAASSIGRAVILVIMYAETFKSKVVVFISNILFV